MVSLRADERAAQVFEDVASALDAGLPLETIGGDPRHHNQTLTALLTSRGVTLRKTEALALEAGWRSGNASQALRKRAGSRRRRHEFMRAAQAAVAYPVLLFALLLLASLATMSFVGPGVAITLGAVYAAGCVGVVTLARKLGRGDASLERLPMLGGVLRELRELPYLEAMHALYGAGVSVVDAHRDATATVHMQGLRAQLGVALRQLEQGRSLREALETSASLSPETRTLLATGEQAGQLEEALERAVERRAEMAKRRLEAAARTLGAVAYGLAAVGVAVLAVTFYLNYYGPLLDMLR